MARAEDSRAIIQEAFTTYNAGDLDAYAGFYADPVVRIDPNSGETQQVSRQQARAENDGFRQIISDHQCTIASIVAEDGRVAVRYVNSGTHTGASALLGEPTGQEVRWAGWSEYRLEDGLIVEVTALTAMHVLLRQLGRL
jgi:predicted ester cyclase